MSRYHDLHRAWDDRAFKGYASVTLHPWRWVLGLFVLIAAVVLIGWQVDWWFAGQNANREAHIIRQGYSNQQTLREQITTNIGNVLAITTQVTETGDPGEKAALTAQRSAVLAIVCQDADEVTGDPLPSDQVRFVQANCEAGNVRPGSPYTRGVNP